MSKISYASLKLKVDTSVINVKYGDVELEILKYLPIEEKNSLINLTLQNSFVNGIYDPLLLDTLFHTYLVYMYTNISFTDKQKENPFKIYDNLKSSGLLDEILKTIPESEYNSLLHFLEEAIEKSTKFNNSIYGILQSFIENIPEQAEKLTQQLQNFDMNKYQNVIDFAKAANGDREI